MLSIADKVCWCSAHVDGVKDVSLDAAAAGHIVFSHDRCHCLSTCHWQATINTWTWEWRRCCKYLLYPTAMFHCLLLRVLGAQPTGAEASYSEFRRRLMAIYQGRSTLQTRCYAVNPSVLSWLRMVSDHVLPPMSHSTVCSRVLVK